MSIQGSVAKAILSLGWEPGLEYWTHTEWVKLRKELDLKATTHEWRSLCANLVKNLVDLGVVSRGEGYFIEVVSLAPLEDMVEEDQDQSETVDEVYLEDIKLVKVRARALPVGARVYMLRTTAIEHLIDNDQVRFQDIHDEPSLPGWAYVTWAMGHSINAEPLITREAALKYVQEGVLAFEDVKENF